MTGTSIVVPYLMLVSFLTPPLGNPEVFKIRNLDDTPYNGVAVMLRSAYSSQKIHQGEFDSTVRVLKLSSKKDIWPWVFFNRFIGVKAGDESTPYAKTTKLSAPFKLIKGMDINNETGALEDFYNSWMIALRTARNLESPGIVLDTEAYNNYLTAELPYLAELLSLPVEQVMRNRYR